MYQAANKQILTTYSKVALRAFQWQKYVNLLIIFVSG